MMTNLDPNMETLAGALDNASKAYRDVAESEMCNGSGYGGCGSIDKVYDCVRNSRNLQNKSRRVRQYNSVY